MFKRKKKYLVIRNSRDIGKVKKIIKKNRELRRKMTKKLGRKLKRKPQVRLEYY